LSYALDTLRGLGATMQLWQTLHSTTPFRCISADHQLRGPRRQDAAQSPRAAAQERSREHPPTPTTPFSANDSDTKEKAASSSRSEGFHSASVPRGRRGGVGADLEDQARPGHRARRESGLLRLGSAGVAGESATV
jgi:hypothetical protein